MARTNRKKFRKNYLGLMILIVVVVCTVGVVLSFIIPGSPGYTALVRTTRNMNIPVVIVNLQSKDGEYHVVQTKFTVALDRKKSGSISSGKLHKQIEGIMSRLDYEKIRDVDGIQYVKDEVKEGLKGYMDPDIVQDIYITTIQIDRTAQGSQMESDDIFQDNGTFDGLFGN